MTIEKQLNLFSRETMGEEEEKKYDSKIEAPIYEPKNIPPHILELCDNRKTLELISDIKKSNVSIQEKDFLIKASMRHIVFNYERIADYYSHASKEMQDLMERSALIIIDFDKAIENGYVKLCEDIKKQYMEEYAE